MAPRDGLGELEEMVLLAVLRLGEGAYGASVLRELDERTGRDVPRGSVYVALERLEAKGMVTSHPGDPVEGRGGRPPRMVRVTARGVESLRRVHRDRTRLRDGLEEVFDT